MSDLELEVTKANGASQTFQIPMLSEDTFEQLAERIQEQTCIDGYAILQTTLAQPIPDDMSTPLGSITNTNHKLNLNTVCIVVHYESETEQQFFPKHAPWSTVHRWACNKFQVAHDACANLELREVTPTGAPINEREKIGDSDDCTDVWLLKPGPEQNG